MELKPLTFDSYLPIRVVIDDGREYFSLVKIVIGRNEIEDDPVSAVGLDAILQLLVVQAEHRVRRRNAEQQLVPEKV